MFSDSHLMVVRELVQGPATFAELGRRTGLSEAVLSRDLAGLRIVGCVTHDRKQAVRAAMQPGTKAGVEGSAGTASTATHTLAVSSSTAIRQNKCRTFRTIGKSI